MSKKFYLVPVLVFILFVFSTGCVYASNLQEPVDDMSGYDSWSESEKNQYKEYLLRMALPGITGYGFDTISDDILANDYPAIYTQGYDSYIDFLLAHSSLDVENDSIVFDDDAMGYINYVKEEVDEQLSYIDVYLPSVEQMSVDSFTNRYAYLGMYELIKANPDYCVRILNHTSYNSRTFTFEDGSSIKLAGWREVYIRKVPYAFVCADLDLAWFNATFYMDDWSTNCDYYNMKLVDNGTSAYVLYYLYDNDDGTSIYKKIDLTTNASDMGNINVPNDMYLNDNGNPSGTASSYVGAQRSFCDDYTFKTTYITAHTGNFRCYTSVTAMKEGTGGTAQIMPGYTSGAITDNSITTSEVNEYITNYNYYYGTDSGTDTDTGTGSGGSGLNGLLDGLGSLGDVVLSILGKLVEIIADIVEILGDAIMSIIDIIPENVGVFFSAIFSFIPEEWIKITTLSLALALIIVIIKIARG